MYNEFAAVLVFTVLGSILVFGALFLGSLLRAKNPNQEKNTIYECGEPTIGTAWIRFNSRFYNIALVYLLFDVEVVVLFPAALVIREKAAQGEAVAPLIGLLVFIGILTVGLAYEWFYGNLDWIRKPHSNNHNLNDTTFKQTSSFATGLVSESDSI